MAVGGVAKRIGGGERRERSSEERGRRRRRKRRRVRVRGVGVSREVTRRGKGLRKVGFNGGS